MLTLAVLLAAAFLAGALNAVAGGGTFITLPALVFAGVPPIAANATSTLAALPGYCSSIVAYRRDLGPARGTGITSIVLASLAGGVAGSLLLLVTSAPVFERIVPWLLLVSTGLFAFAPRLLERARRLGAGSGAVLPGVFAVSVYGGYFNGGLGILLLALFALLGLADINHMNGLKVVISAALSIISVVIFAVGGLIVWREGLVMAAAAAVGGYAGARLARRLPEGVVRAIVVATGLAMSAAFFARRSWP